jgi:hypothetical protein
MTLSGMEPATKDRFVAILRFSPSSFAQIDPLYIGDRDVAAPSRLLSIDCVSDTGVLLCMYVLFPLSRAGHAVSAFSGISYICAFSYVIRDAICLAEDTC